MKDSHTFPLRLGPVVEKSVCYPTQSGGLVLVGTKQINDSGLQFRAAQGRSRCRLGDLVSVSGRMAAMLCLTERERESARLFIGECSCDRKGALCALESVGHGAPLCSEGVGGARRTEALPLLFQVRLSHFKIPLWMNPESAVAIADKKTDGLKGLSKTAFIKVSTFVGLYL